MKGNYSDSFLEEKWDGLTDIPFGEDENGELFLTENYWLFDKGIDRDFIWHFFDEYHSKGVAWLLYDYNREEGNYEEN